ncbi:LysR family transcriptional regulator [Rhizobium sp. CSW-27]|uniref:LysR family transcriptional regulator n=1 Tax=Rhizobium sp. CSW-27 TaxID=2839985 RepID=UPI001C038E99|nr:LysR family transcriptional regulator [Rhizobium sp. CSW-27]MBT9373023.1 LysR family transcriptional regulator [Rhizobium sp. CSW-27]
MYLTSPRIRAFNAVMETGSFSAAATKLGLSQPAITQAVREIEQAAKVTLFQRQGRSLAQTALCAELYRFTAEAERLAGEALRVLEQHANLETGKFRIGIGNSMPGMALIREFRRRLPGVQVQVELGSWATILKAVVEQRVDVGVLPNVPNDGRFERKVCLKQDVVAIVSEESPLARSTQTSCTELLRYPLIFRTQSSSTQKVVDQGFRSAKLTPVPMMVLDTRDGVYEAAANGLGVGFMWEFGSSREDKIRKIRVIEFEQGHPEHVFHLSGRTSPLITAFEAIQL